MSELDLQHVEHLFHAAADLPADQRSGFLQEHCSGDTALRSRLEALLARHDRDESLMSPALEAAAPGFAGGPFTTAAITEGPGTVIDRYKLLQTIGEGGFGVVYMAEQQQPVVRKVALKVIKLGMDTREVVARFEAERQALAMMDHPGIARVLDGGATPSGRPYFVMQLVRGVPITDFCDRNELTTTERLELFVQVCQAIQHAHQKGIIHRDLKPSNVLVTLDNGSPRPMVIDFGVAKAMHTRLTEKTLFTRYEQFMGTPAYMSPEQAQMSALDVDTRTDIYSLGVLLYELLTGTTPLDTDSLLREGLAEVQRAIREQQPPRPSLRISTTGDASIARHRGVDTASLSRRVRGDLDWIVMKSLEKDRRRRYATASELADDVHRHLGKEPVLAGPPGAAYRVRKLLARNRAAVVSMTLIALALVAGIIGTTLGMLQADRSAQLAEERADHAVAALDFLVSTLALTNPEIALDPEVTVLTLLDHTSARVADAFADQPWAEVRVRSTIGRAYASLSEYELAEPHLRRAVELVDGLTAAGDGFDGSGGFDDGDFYTILWQLTNVCFNLERDDAFAVSNRAHDVGVGHIGATHPRLEQSLDRFNRALEAGAWSHEPDAMDGVAELFESAAVLAETSLDHGDSRWLIVADLLLAAGYTVWYTPHEPLSERFFAKALQIQQRELAPDHPDIATTVGLLVGVLNKAGKTEQAERLIRSSIESLRRVHREGDFRIAVAESMLGENLIRQGRFEEAEPILLGAHEVMLATIKNESNFMAVESFIRLVNLYDAWGRPDDAAPFRDSLAGTGAAGRHIMQWEIGRQAFGPEHARLIILMDEAKQLCGGVHYLAAVGSLQAPGLEELLGELLAVRRELLDDEELRAVTVARLLLGWINGVDPRRHLEARRLVAEEALAILSHRQQELAVEVAEALSILAETAQTRGAVDEARSRALEAWQLARQAPRQGMWFNAAAEVRIARCLLQQRLYAEAETLLTPAYEAFVLQLGTQHGDTHVVRRLLFDLYTSWGRPDDASRFADDDSIHKGDTT